MEVALGEERACFSPLEVLNSVEKVSKVLQLILSSIFLGCSFSNTKINRLSVIFRPFVYLQSVGIVPEVEFILYLQHGLWTAG